MDHSLALVSDLRAFLIPADADKSARARLSLFVEWQTRRRRPWYDIDLKAYRDHLLRHRGFEPTTTSAYLSAVRSRYRQLLTDNDLRVRWLTAIGQELAQLNQMDSPANRRALLDEYHTRIRNAIDPSVAPVEKVVSQDRVDADQIRLTQSQAEALLRAPGTETLPALRDTCVIALMLCTGVREAELCALEVEDLRQKLKGVLALHIRLGKGAKERAIPYGDLVWVLQLVDRWLARAEIRTGRVLRAFWRGNEKIRNSLSVRAVEDILSQYPLVGDDGHNLIVRPHDLRRTYARRQYETGLDLISISQNLGHADTKTTLLYIGDLSAEQRQSKLAYSYDLSQLR